MNLSEISNEFERLIETREIKFNKCKLEDLQHKWVRELVTMFLEREHIGWQIGDIELDSRAVCIKIEDPYLQYLDIYYDTRQFMWCIDDHHDSITPDQASQYLIQKYVLKAEN